MTHIEGGTLKVEIYYMRRDDGAVTYRLPESSIVDAVEWRPPEADRAVRLARGESVTYDEGLFELERDDPDAAPWWW